MYGLQSDTAPSVPVTWQRNELDEVVTRLSSDFPGKTPAELEHAVEYCKGAVRRYQGVDALHRFASALLRSVDVHMAKAARGLPR